MEWSFVQSSSEFQMKSEEEEKCFFRLLQLLHCLRPTKACNISPLARFFAQGTNVVSCVVTYHELKALLCDGGIAMPCLISQGICTVFRELYNLLLCTCDCAFQSMYTCMCIVQCGFAYMHKAQSALHFLLWLYIAPIMLCIFCPLETIWVSAHVENRAPERNVRWRQPKCCVGICTCRHAYCA